jgi:hypothetical protein
MNAAEKVLSPGEAGEIVARHGTQSFALLKQRKNAQIGFLTTILVK